MFSRLVLLNSSHPTCDGFIWHKHVISREASVNYNVGCNQEGWSVLTVSIIWKLQSWFSHKMNISIVSQNQNVNPGTVLAYEVKRKPRHLPHVIPLDSRSLASVPSSLCLPESFHICFISNVQSVKLQTMKRTGRNMSTPSSLVGKLF